MKYRLIFLILIIFIFTGFVQSAPSENYVDNVELNQENVLHLNFALADDLNQYRNEEYRILMLDLIFCWADGVETIEGCKDTYRWHDSSYQRAIDAVEIAQDQGRKLSATDSEISDEPDAISDKPGSWSHGSYSPACDSVQGFVDRSEDRVGVWYYCEDTESSEGWRRECNGAVAEDTGYCSVKVDNMFELVEEDGDIRVSPRESYSLDSDAESQFANVDSSTGILEPVTASRVYEFRLQHVETGDKEEFTVVAPGADISVDEQIMGDGDKNQVGLTNLVAGEEYDTITGFRWFGIDRTEILSETEGYPTEVEFEMGENGIREIGASISDNAPGIGLTSELSTRILVGDVFASDYERVPGWRNNAESIKRDGWMIYDDDSLRDEWFEVRSDYQEDKTITTHYCSEEWVDQNSFLYKQCDMTNPELLGDNYGNEALWLGTNGKYSLSNHAGSNADNYNMYDYPDRDNIIASSGSADIEKQSNTSVRRNIPDSDEFALVARARSGENTPEDKASIRAWNNNGEVASYYLEEDQYRTLKIDFEHVDAGGYSGRGYWQMTVSRLSSDLGFVDEVYETEISYMDSYGFMVEGNEDADSERELYIDWVGVYTG